VYEARPKPKKRKIVEPENIPECTDIYVACEHPDLNEKGTQTEEAGKFCMNGIAKFLYNLQSLSNIIS